MNFLDFEQPIAELEAKIDELKFVSSDAEVNIGEEIARLRAKSRALTTSIFSNLTQWQIAQLARHPQRPYTLDYISVDLHRLPGAARRSHVRRRSRHRRRAGAARRQAGDDHRPAEGPRHQGARAPQLRHAEAGGLSQGAAPDAHGRALPAAARSRSSIPRAPIPASAPRSAARAKRSRATCSRCRRCEMPIVSIVIGEGGSGGALAIGVCDRLLMLQYSIYSVISPEGCAGILWRSADKKDLAAEAMGVSAERIAKLGVVDEVHQGAARRRASRSAGDGRYGQGRVAASPGRAASRCRSSSS